MNDAYLVGLQIYNHLFERGLGELMLVTPGERSVPITHRWARLFGSFLEQG